MCRECEARYKFYDRSRYLKVARWPGDGFYLAFDESLSLLDEPVFDPDATKRMPSIGTSAYVVLELAAWLGFKEIYMLGCDMSYPVNITRDGKLHYNAAKKDHFYSAEDECVKVNDRTPAPTWQLEVAFDAAAKYAKENGIKIYNATRGGMLESFERVEFDGLF